jgi:hypothetical protein
MATYDGCPAVVESLVAVQASVARLLAEPRSGERRRISADTP